MKLLPTLRPAANVLAGPGVLAVWYAAGGPMQGSSEADAAALSPNLLATAGAPPEPMKRIADPDRARRARWRAYHRDHEALAAAWREAGYPYPAPVFPRLPDELRGLTCGAKTRAGTPCKRTDLMLSGRCKLHGGLSTGPKTAEGKSRSAENGCHLRRKQTP